MGMSEGQINSLLQGAAFSEGESAADYREFPPKMEKQENTTTVLMVGINRDAEANTERGDAIVLAQFNLETGTVKWVSFLHDMHVRVPGKGADRLDAMYAIGGAELISEALQMNFGVYVDYVLAMDDRVMVDTVDQFGGISLMVAERERLQFNALAEQYQGDPTVSPLAGDGEQLLTGRQALLYSRIQRMVGDFDRASRQSRLMEAMISDLGDVEPNTLLTLAEKHWPDLQTDFTRKELSDFITRFMQFSNVAVDHMVVPLSYAFHDDVIRNAIVLIPNLTKNSSAIHAFLQN